MHHYLCSHWCVIPRTDVMSHHVMIINEGIENFVDINEDMRKHEMIVGIIK